MRKTYVYLLNSLLLVGLFIGCDPKEDPPGPPKDSPEMFTAKYTIKIEGPPETAVLLNAAPKGFSALQDIGCIVLAFNKKPKYLKTDPPLEFYFADEVESNLGDLNLQNLHDLKIFESPISDLATVVYIRVPDIRSKRSEGNVWIFKASWGPTMPQPSIELVYVIAEPAVPLKVYVEVPPKAPLDVRLGLQVPPGPAILLNVFPRNGSVVRSLPGIILEFNKKPKYLKTSPPRQPYFADEFDESELEDWRERYYYKGDYDYVGSPPIRNWDTSVFILDLPTLPRDPGDPVIRVIEVSWGAEHPQRAVNLIYTLGGLF